MSKRYFTKNYKNSGFPQNFLDLITRKEDLADAQRKIFAQLNERWKEYDLQNTVEQVKPRKNKP